MKDIVFWLRKFVMIYGIIMICTFFMCYFFNPTSTLPVVSFFGRIIFTILGMLTLFVYYSKEELSQKQWWIRTLLHIVILELVFLPLAHLWHFWYGFTDALIYGSFILFAKGLWHLIDYGMSAKTASQINEQIRMRRKES